MTKGYYGSPASAGPIKTYMDEELASITDSQEYLKFNSEQTKGRRMPVIVDLYHSYVTRNRPPEPKDFKEEFPDWTVNHDGEWYKATNNDRKKIKAKSAFGMRQALRGEWEGIIEE